jgi:DNA-binding transcriptional ArsR family regulator
LTRNLDQIRYFVYEIDEPRVAARLHRAVRRLRGRDPPASAQPVLDEIQPKISRHLATLRDAGFVRVRRQGKWKFYRLTEHPSPLQARLIACVRSCLSEVDVLAADRARLASLRGSLRCT